MERVQEILRMMNITKVFPGVKALDKVKIDLKSGEVHALMGENGAGKSTLMKIIAGAQLPDEGEYFLSGESISLHSPKEAQLKGISIIYQELNLIPHLSIAENIFLGREPKKKGGFIDWKRMYDNTSQLLTELGLQLNPREKVINISIGNRQMVEIAKALSFHAKVIIMDEPTSALENNEIEYLFHIIESLKKKGVGVFYITHKMEEVFRISDRITVFRDGKYIDTVNVLDTSIEEIIKMMVGRELTALFPERKVSHGEVIIEVQDMSVPNKLEGITFQVKEGEILGIAGLMGCGKSELSKALFGYYKDMKGTVKIRGKEISLRTPKDAIDHRIALVPEDRKIEGLVLERDIRENIMLPSLKEISPYQILHLEKEKAIVKEQIHTLNIKVSGLSQISKNLSGGNQQKVVLGKWLETKPDILILAEPTKGIDIGAKTEIYKLISDLAQEGMAIIYISSELPEIIGICDRVLVMHERKIAAELKDEKIIQEEIMYYSSGGEKSAG